MPNKDLEGRPSEELRTRKAHRMSDDETEDQDPSHPECNSGRDSQFGQWMSEKRRRQSPPELRERHSRLGGQK
jgi:hypothetical protein